MKPNAARILMLLVVLSLITLFLLLDLGQYLTLDFIKSQQRAFTTFYADHRLLTIAIYFVIYVAVTALSLPGAAVMTLAGGALLGLWVGVVVVSFASTLGATLAFLVSRFVLHDMVQHKFGDKLQAINDGVKKEGAFYLFSLRLVPLFPFFVINLVMGLTPIRPLTYALVSQIGMLPGTLVYVNAGTQLGQLESAAGILSPSLLLSFALLGLFPLLSKKILGWVKRRRQA